MDGALENKNSLESSFAEFIGGFFSLMARATPEELRMFAVAARSLNPELSDLISQMATFKESYLSGGANSLDKAAYPSSTSTIKSSNGSAAFDNEIESMFRDKRLFKNNADLIEFLKQTFSIEFNSKTYSRSSIIRRFLIFSRGLGAIEKSELIKNLRNVRNHQAHHPKERSFFRAWSEVIKNS